jgi:hypothetical protein
MDILYLMAGHWGIKMGLWAYAAIGSPSLNYFPRGGNPQDIFVGYVVVVIKSTFK